MNPPTEPRPKADLRDSLAAERTFLAWIRTGLAFMGFGFVVARFGLFLQQLELIRHATAKPSYGLSLYFGTTLIAAGVVVNLFSAWQHHRLMKQLERGGTVPARSATQAVLIALFLALVGLAMAIYLVSTRESSSLLRPASVFGGNMTQGTNQGLTDISSHHSVEQTVERLKNILQSKGVTLFALIDHSGEAEKVGMKMRPTKLLIFGSPKAGTPLMLAAPTVAIDLPLKILIWEDASGKVWVTYNNPEFLRARHGLPQDLMQNVSVVEALASKAAE